MLATIFMLTLGMVSARADDARIIFSDAVAVWNMSDALDSSQGARSALSPIGEAAFGVTLPENERGASLAHGGDGRAARVMNGSLSAGQGTDGELNISGTAVTVMVRLQRTGGTWDITPLTKHGGHDKLQYNLYCFQRAGARFELGAEVGTDKGLARATAIIVDTTPGAWHDLVLRYDGRSLDLFFDGSKRASKAHSGELRANGPSPVVIGGEPQGDSIGRRFTGLIDHAAVWKRALSDEEIRTLNGGVAAPFDDARPVLHFTPERNWINDPNGLIYHDGEYHLFYQYNPFGDQWGHMSWGHAVSRDLLDWEHLPVAIPEADGVMAFSGTAVFDAKNTSGLGAPGKPPLVAVYTGHEEGRRLQHQNLAFSVDRGRTWTKYAGNPVLDLGLAEFRDPKVFWHDPTSRWIMVVSVSAERKAAFFASPDLKSWTKLSEFGPQGRDNVPNWECPDLFEMPLDGNAADTRWVLVINVGGNGPATGFGCQYFVGRFDGERFVNENPPGRVLWVNHGMDFYAFQSFEAAPDGKRIGMAWMSNGRYTSAVPTSPWRGSMTVPREFKLVSTVDGPRLTQTPVGGVREALIERGGKEEVLDGQKVAGAKKIELAGRTAYIEAEFEVGSAERFGVRVLEEGEEATVVGYDVRLREMYLDRRRAGDSSFSPAFAGQYSAPLSIGPKGRVKLTIVVDKDSVEVFGGEGRAAITSLVFPTQGGGGISVFAEDGDVTLVRLSGVALPVR